MPPRFRVIITSPDKPAATQFHAVSLEKAKAELKRYTDKGFHGRYVITEVVENTVEQGEC